MPDLELHCLQIRLSEFCPEFHLLYIVTQECKSLLVFKPSFLLVYAWFISMSFAKLKTILDQMSNLHRQSDQSIVHEICTA